MVSRKKKLMQLQSDIEQLGNMYGGSASIQEIKACLETIKEILEAKE